MDNKKLNRFCDDPKAKVIPCSYCTYRFGEKLACEAYPKKIPTLVLRRVYEDPEKECAKGYKYTPKNK